MAGRLPHGVAVRTWHDLATYFVQVNTMFGGFLNVIRAIILLVTLFILANTMNRIVRERMREWGTLRAVGTKKSTVLLLVVLEGCFLGVVGSRAGDCPRLRCLASSSTRPAGFPSSRTASALQSRS